MVVTTGSSTACMGKTISKGIIAHMKEVITGFIGFPPQLKMRSITNLFYSYYHTSSNIKINI
jgi:hypothetical protein